MILIRIFLLTVCVFSSQVYAQSYICITDSSTGFSSANNWEITSFKANDKFIIKPSSGEHGVFDSNKLYKYSVFMAGEDEAYAGCKAYEWNDDPKDDLYNYYSCDGTITFIVDIGKLRFMLFYDGGYIFNRSNMDPSISIGKCSEL